MRPQINADALADAATSMLKMVGTVICVAP